MMRNILLLVLVCFSCSVGAVMPAAASALEVRIEHVSLTGQVTVSMRNLGTEPLRVWRNGNQWGSARWRVMHISNGVLQTYYQNPDQIFSPNFPGFNELSATKPVQITLDLKDRNWLPRVEEVTEEVTWAPGDTVIVVYDVPTSDEAQKHGVWYGVIAAMTIVR